MQSANSIDERLTHRFWNDRSIVKNMKALCRTFVLEDEICYLDTVGLSVAPDVRKRLSHRVEVAKL
jgi:hypothetical protein